MDSKTNKHLHKPIKLFDVLEFYLNLNFIAISSKVDNRF